MTHTDPLRDSYTNISAHSRAVCPQNEQKLVEVQQIERYIIVETRNNLFCVVITARKLRFKVNTNTILSLIIKIIFLAYIPNVLAFSNKIILAFSSFIVLQIMILIERLSVKSQILLFRKILPL